MATSPATATAPVGWLTRDLASGVAVKLTEDGVAGAMAAATPATGWYLPAQPRLIRDRSGQPVFSLTLILSAQPGPRDDSINALIQQGVLSLGLTLALQPDGPIDVDGQAYRPLFAQAAAFSLTDSGAELATASGMGVSAHASLAVPLAREQAIAVLGALKGSPSNLAVHCEVRYRTRTDPVTTSLSGSWAAIYDWLAAQPGAAQGFSQEQLLRAFESLVGVGIIDAKVQTSDGSRPATAADLRAVSGRFLALSAMVLHRLTPTLTPDDLANVYRLRDRPDDWMRLNLVQAIASTGDATVPLEATLADVLSGCLDGLDWGEYVHLIGPTGALGGGLSPTPRRVRSGRAIAPEQISMAAQPDRSFRALPLMMRPVATVSPSAAATIKSDAAAPAVPISPAVAHIPIGDVIVDPPDTGVLQPLPVVEDPASPAWHDRANPASYWYPSAFALVQPAPNADPGTSPFLFTCQQTGATAAGRGLDGSVRFTLNRAMSAASRAAIPGGAPSQALPLGNLAVSLELPFRDQDGTTKVHPLTGTVQQTGDTLTITVKLLDDWVKLAYGALAYPNFQTQPARLAITYTYQAYTIVRPGGLGLGYGGKVAQIPVIASAVASRSIPDQPYFDSSSQTFQTPSGAVRFYREVPGTSASQVPISARLGMLASPSLEAAPILTNILNRTHYAVQTLARQEKIDVFFPCSSLGGFYDLNGSGGCQDAFKLDQTKYQLYEEIKELKHPLYQILRSLQQPGLFLVVPASYRITRFGKTEGDRAYRPAIAVYATIDLTATPPTQYVVRATLQPDLPAYARRELLAKLEAYAQSPVIQFPTEIDSVPDYEWLVGAPAPCK